MDYDDYTAKVAFLNTFHTAGLVNLNGRCYNNKVFSMV